MRTLIIDPTFADENEAYHLNLTAFHSDAVVCHAEVHGLPDLLAVLPAWLDACKLEGSALVLPDLPTSAGEGSQAHAGEMVIKCAVLDADAPAPYVEKSEWEEQTPEGREFIRALDDGRILVVSAASGPRHFMVAAEVFPSCAHYQNGAPEFENYHESTKCPGMTLAEVIAAQKAWAEAAAGIAC